MEYDFKTTLEFFKRHFKVLAIVFAVAMVVSVVVSLLITPLYKSTAVLFPTNSNRISKAILAERYSHDFMDYGGEKDCEYAIQILTSKSMENDVCNRFNLMEHYEIKENDPHKFFKLSEMYNGYVSVKRTKYLGVEISVLDKDPQMAADIANFMASNYDTLSSRIHHDRANDAYMVMCGICAELEANVRALEDTLRKDKSRLGVSELLTDKCQELAALQTRMSETHVDMQRTVSYKFWLDQAVPADKKDSPKRTIVVLLGTLGTLIVCIFALLIFDRCRKDEDED